MIVLLPLLLACWTILPQQGPILTEFLASNQDGLEDEDGDNSDWIEIYNPDSTSVDMGGSFLTDDATNLTKWMFPTPTVIPAGGILLVFASDKDRSISGQELHTNFKLTTAGEYLGLVNANGTTIQNEFAPNFGPQYPDISYGRRFSPAITTDESYFSSPTPDTTNGTGGPCVISTSSTPNPPQDNEDIVVNAHILGGSASVISGNLVTKIMFGSETPLILADNGVFPDSIAGDDLWTGSISSSLSLPGEMVRWRITAQDSLNQSGKAPLNAISDSAEYFGTVVVDSTIATPLSAMHWFVQNPNQANTVTGTRCSLWHLGEFYDNLYCRIRGGSSSGYPKTNYKMDFNPGEKIRMIAGVNRMEEINLNSTWSDKSYIRQVLAWEIYQNVGSAGPLSEYIHLRQNGSFYGAFIFVEQVDDELLDRAGLDDEGALYKMYNQCTSASSGVEKKNRTWEGNQDLQALVNGVKLTGTALENFLFDNVDLPAVISYLVATALINDNDHVHKNYYLYRDSDGDGEWRFLPWDKDLTLGRNYTLSGGVLNDSMWADRDPQCHPLFGDSGHRKIDGYWNRFIDACYRDPRVLEMYVRRLWTVMEEQLQAPGTSTSQLVLENRILDLQQLLTADVALDVARWGSPSWGSSKTFQQGLDQLTQDFLAKKRVHLFQTHTQSGVLPGAPVSAPAMILGTMETDPVSGDDDEEWLQLINPTNDAVDLSGWTLTGGIDFDFHPGTVVPAGEAVYLSPKLEAFRTRTTSPTAGEGNFLLGPYDGNLKVGEDLFLWDDDGNLITSTSATFTLFVSDLISGQPAVFSLAGANPNSSVVLAWSVAGGGPTSTPWGVAELTQPIRPFPTLTADSSGTASMPATVPSNTNGIQIWFQALDIAAGVLSNGESQVIQ